jgi:hypothetical protein
MDRNTVQKILIGLFISACLFIGLRTFNIASSTDNQLQIATNTNTNVTSSRMTYGKTSRFI